MATIRSNGPTDVAVAPKGVWLVNHRAASISRIDPDTDSSVVVARNVGTVPERITTGFGELVGERSPGVFGVLPRPENRLLAGDCSSASGASVYAWPAGRTPSGVGAGARLFAVDPATNTVAGSVKIGSPDQGGQGIIALAPARGGVWVTSTQGDVYLVSLPKD